MNVTQARVARSEWTKLRSLPSTAWCLLTAVALIVGFGVLYSGLRVARPPHPGDGFDPTAVSLAGVQLAQVAVGVLGALLVTGEYATGAVRATFAAVPRRLPVLWGKAVVFGLTAFAVCLPATVATFLIGQSIMDGRHLGTTFGHAGTARAVVGSALYLTVVGLLGLALGALLRGTAGAIAALFGLLYALQLATALLPGRIADSVFKYLPAPAGIAVTTVRPDPQSLAPWVGFGLFCGYTAVLLGLAAWRLRRRDVT